MISRVLADYKVKFQFISIYIIFIIYLIVCFYIIGGIAFVAFPYFLALNMYEDYEIKQNKLFYIIPLSLEERREYYKSMFFINLIIPETIEVLIGVILMALGKLELRFFIFVSVSLCMYIICKNLDIRKYLKDNVKLYWDEFYWYGISMKASEILAFGSVVYTIWHSMKVVQPMFANVCIIVLIFIQLWMLKSILRHRTKIIEFIINPSEF